MNPTLRRTRTLHVFRALGIVADELEWWRPGVPLADGFRIADVVCPPAPAPEPVGIFDQLALSDQVLVPA